MKKYGLVLFTWGNVSAIDRERGLIVIKPSGVDYDKLNAADMVVVDLDGNVVEGSLKPSSDVLTHVELYKAFEDIGSVTHTHSTWATIYAQAGIPIKAYGTTHADHFNGDISCTRCMTNDEINNSYEKNTGKVIVETFQNLNYNMIPAVLVYAHGPFTWGKNAIESVNNNVVLENIAYMAFNTKLLRSKEITSLAEAQSIPNALLLKHYYRKHGKKAYYGQNNV